MKRMVYIFGILSILICLGTWSIDLFGWVNPCLYCRIERTIIGLLGLIILLPKFPFNYYLSFVFGFFGASVTSQQLLLFLRNFSFTIEIALVMAALFIIIGQMLFIYYYFVTSKKKTE